MVVFGFCDSAELYIPYVEPVLKELVIQKVIESYQIAIKPSSRPFLLFYSLPARHQGRYDCRKILICGEPGFRWPRENLKKLVPDLFISCCQEERAKQVYLPFWVLSFAERFRNKPEDLVARKNPPKTKFCAYTYSQSVPERERLFEKVNSYKPVDALGKNKHNCGEQDRQTYGPGLTYNDTLVEKNLPYKFVICCENSIEKGYVTEKIVSAMLAGAIPIYQGTEEIVKHFNQNSFLRTSDPTWFTRLQELDGDNDLYESMRQQAWLTQLPNFFSPTYLAPHIKEVLFNSRKVRPHKHYKKRRRHRHSRRKKHAPRPKHKSSTRAAMEKERQNSFGTSDPWIPESAGTKEDYARISEIRAMLLRENRPSLRMPVIAEYKTISCSVWPSEIAKIEVLSIDATRLKDFMTRVASWRSLVHHHPGVDGRTLNLATLKTPLVLKKPSPLQKTPKQLTRGEIACWLGHVAIWKRLEQESQEFTMICEDDANLRDLPVLAKHLNTGFQEILQIGEFDLFYIGHKSHSIKERLSDNVSAPIGCQGLFCYIVSKKGLKNLLDICKSIVSAIDVQVADASDAGKIRTLTLDPSLIFVIPVSSTTSNFK